jgi:hypothetical protein
MHKVRNKEWEYWNCLSVPKLENGIKIKHMESINLSMDQVRASIAC